MITIFACVATLAALVAASGTLQDRLLYYPDRSLPSEGELNRRGIRFWPEGRNGYRGFAATFPEGKRRGTVVVLHGNAATAAERIYYLEPLHRLGYRVILAEYPGYGGREGKPAEKAFVADARETIRVAGKMYGGPVYLLGESLGGAVAASALRDLDVGIAGLILITPWAALEQLAKELFPYLPVRLLMTDRYDTVGNLRGFSGPTVVVAAEKDEIIPPRHATELYEALSGRKKMWVIPGAGHNDWPDVIRFSLWEEIMAFVAPLHSEGGRKEQ